ncbi:MAG: S8/S53 family peptidase [Herpetosiphonaceae bacterium]|nr:S8/S53 family peptidase [Herpetosiphonaceae bacterium]
MYEARLPPPPEPQPLQYFVPNQMLLLVEHTGRISPEQLASFIKVVEQPLDGVRLGTRRVLTFTSPQTADKQAPAFSLVFLTVQGISDSTERLIPLIDHINDQLRQQAIAGLTLQVASPDWLLSGAPDHIGTGGPGTPPLSVAGSTLAGAGNFLASDAPWAWTLPDRLAPKLPPEQRGTGVDIAILDTAPCVHDLVHAYDRWQATQPLLRSLLRPGGQLHVQNADYSDLVRLAGYQLKDHRYVMADHGLFVAGIIHTLAPQANLHLIEVLNPYGVGDLESIALGLWRLTKRQSQRPLLINCSLVVNIPLPGHPHPELNWERLINEPELAKLMGLPLESICNTLLGEQVQVVAAAGNDSSKHDLPARFPAAFNSVVGVGALQKDGQPASYSNLSDTPVPNSIATFGGTAHTGLATAGEAVLGVFTGDFPGTTPGSTTPNTNGWAWWSGTSFATPVVTGVLAALMSQGMSASAASSMLQTADQTHAQTNAGEGVLAVRQGS